MTSYSPAAITERDLASYSNSREVRSNAIHLDWSIDWSAQTVGGSVTHEMVVLERGDIEEVVLDTRDLEISKVEVEGKELKYEIKPRHEVLGSALHIALAKVYKPSTKFTLTIHYSTTKNCSALGWLTAEQTAGGSHPYLYSQSQAIHARSLLPSQDTPSIKSTYTASIRSVLPVLMSAKRVSPPSEEVIKPGKEVEYKFEQGVRIPSYLIAIAAGNLVYKAFDASVSKGRWSSGVWTEPELVESAFWEFSEDTAKFVHTAETLTESPYAWGIYDVLVLPPSFPYGGMENPCITFGTPTLLAGDRSLVDVVAHEIAHSWFGNLIGCASWAHFWLNEGWTTYHERLIVGEARGPAARGLSYIIGAKALQESLDGYEKSGQGRFQRLVVKYEEGEDPDDAFSSIPYNKGANLILHLEQTLGGLDAFKPYIQSYVSTFAGQSISTEMWKDHLYSFWKKHGGEEAIKKLDSVKWDEWLHGEGTKLPVEMKYDTSLADSAYDLASRWHQAGSDSSKLAEFKSTDLDFFGAEQTMVFLEKLQSYKRVSIDAVRKMDEVYAFGQSKNAELSFRFLQIALMTGTEYANQAADWVTDKGRMKFCRSIYKSLYSVAPELARKTFLAHSSFYHPIARRMIEKDLGLAGGA